VHEKGKEKKTTRAAAVSKSAKGTERTREKRSANGEERDRIGPVRSRVVRETCKGEKKFWSGGGGGGNIGGEKAERADHKSSKRAFHHLAT